MPPAKANKGNVRTPPGRLVSAWPKKSSNAKPRKKLNPRRRPKLSNDGTTLMVCARARIEIEPTPPHAGDIKFDRMPCHAKCQLHLYQAILMIAREIGQRWQRIIVIRHVQNNASRLRCPLASMLR